MCLTFFHVLGLDIFTLGHAIHYVEFKKKPVGSKKKGETFFINVPVARCDAQLERIKECQGVCQPQTTVFLWGMFCGAIVGVFLGMSGLGNFNL